VQVEFNQLNAVTKEINLTIPAEEVDKEYEKYLKKSAQEISVPGFRKGKAPLNVVERMYEDKIRNYFYEYYIDEVFSKVVKENEIKYLHYPEVKDVQWEKGNDMTIKIEIEHEPVLEFKQIEGLTVPYKPLVLEEEVNNFIKELQKSNGRVIDVETARETDNVNVEITFQHNNETFTRTGNFFAGTEHNLDMLPELLGLKIGDKIKVKLTGREIINSTQDYKLPLDNDAEYDCELMVNSISRIEYPELDDEFAKDMEFDSLEDMKAKISDDLKLKIEHSNIDIENEAIIAKLFADNEFALPKKTLSYLAEEQVKDIKNDNVMRYYYDRYYISFAYALLSLYITNNLLRLMPIELTDEMKEEYINHLAIVKDMSSEAYKEKYKDDISSEDFARDAQRYFVLRKISQTCEFVIKEEPEENSYPESEIETIKEEQ
jgi:trigger factor